MLSLMLLHIGTALHDLGREASKRQPEGQPPPEGQPQPPEAHPEARALARLALHTCTLLSRPQLLFDRAFPLFSGAPATTGALGAFVEAIEPAVVGGTLVGLGPEVMQALVEHFAARGEVERVERCVLHLSIASLDLDQVGGRVVLLACMHTSVMVCLLGCTAPHAP
jgi:hypothetical protein